MVRKVRAQEPHILWTGSAGSEVCVQDGISASRVAGDRLCMKSPLKGMGKAILKSYSTDSDRMFCEGQGYAGTAEVLTPRSTVSQEHSEGGFFPGQKSPIREGKAVSSAHCEQLPICTQHLPDDTAMSEICHKALTAKPGTEAPLSVLVILTV